MPTLSRLSLTEAKPTDRPHILIWDHCDETDLDSLSFQYGTLRVNYRQDLLGRVKPTSKYLRLDVKIDRELEAIRNLCQTQNSRSYIQLEELDRLITYLAVKGSDKLDIFWQKLIDLNHLPKLLWIILPSTLVPQSWPIDRLQCVESP